MAADLARIVMVTEQLPQVAAKSAQCATMLPGGGRFYRLLRAILLGQARHHRRIFHQDDEGHGTACCAALAGGRDRLAEKPRAGLSTCVLAAADSSDLGANPD